ncbi:ATP-binding protein [Nocardia asteroides]|uniref:ATP-binding protein n=1 Tax=Nocardia asteroides TaxID=1824 RepID=UPI001E28A0DF|nr:ATP-binding protein [Nocardia asteroides]UGT62592.1 ATP-binding protein [Nocardia asteroides]
MSATGGTPVALRQEFPAAAEELAGVRRRLREWLAGVLTDPRHAYDLLLAAIEACTNAVEHGHNSDRRPILLEARVQQDMVRVTVTDHGHWKQPSAGGSTNRGRGLALIGALVPESRITVGDTGTIVELAAPLITA